MTHNVNQKNWAITHHHGIEDIEKDTQYLGIQKSKPQTLLLPNRHFHQAVYDRQNKSL